MPGVHQLLLEREGELDRLSTLLSEAAGGRGSLLVIGAEAGAGKTSLVREFQQRVSNTARVLIGVCDPLSTPQPLGPFLDIVPLAGRSLQSAIAGAPSGRHEIFRVFLNWLVAQQQPVAVIFEDLHWADEATLDLLRFLGRRIEPAGTLLVVTYRDDEVGPTHPLRITLGDLATTRAVQRIKLAPLSLEAVAVLASDSGVDPEDLHRQTGGNPFFVTEVIASGGHGVPPTVRDAVLARVARLSPAARHALDAAAIIGARVERWLLASVLGDRAAAADECVDAGVLVELGSNLVFRHEIVRDAILETMHATEQRELHQMALAILRGRDDDPAYLTRLAHHADAAGDHKAVLEYAPRAAQRASSLNSHREAAAQYGRAARLAEQLPPRERASLLESYSYECTVTDQLDSAISSRKQAIEIRRDLEDKAGESKGLCRLSRVLLAMGHNAKSLEAAQAALKVLEPLPPGPQHAFAYANRAYLLMLERKNQEAISEGFQAIELAHHYHDDLTQIQAYNSVGSAMILEGDFEVGRKYLEQSLQLARKVGLDHEAADAFGNLGSAFGEMYQFRDADGYLSEGIVYCAERDLDYQRLYMLSWNGLSHCYQGRWNDATRVAALVAGRPVVATISRVMALLTLGRVRARRGDPDVWVTLDEALELAQKTRTLQRLGPVRAARAEAAWLAGDEARARAEARSVFDLAVQHEHPWHIGELGYWRWKTGDLDAPPALAAEPFRLQISGDWEAAAEAWEKLLCPYEAARARAESGNAAAMRAGLAAFEALGARPMASMTARRLRNLGARSIPRGPRLITRQNPAGLTARQLQVCELLVEGLENREIAARLYISPKTVEHHVASVFAKLGVSTRAEAAAEASRLGIAGQDRGTNIQT